MNILGVDYGTEHIGLALGSTESYLSQPLTTLSSRQNPISAIRTLVLTHHIDVLIVGISEKISAEQATHFANRLKRVVNVPVNFVDETLSSQEAMSKLLHKSRKRRSNEQHAAAAAVIVERWLDTFDIAQNKR